MLTRKNNLLERLALLVLLVVGFFYRLYGLDANYSFWTDEGHVAIFSRAILERGKPVLMNGYSTGAYQYLQYWLSAISARIFGLNEFAIRFPSVIFGVLTIWAVYLLGKELFSEEKTRGVALIAALFTAFLKIEILWSRQARPYQALQFFFLFGAYFIFKLIKEQKFRWRYFVGFLVCGILASMMHGLGLVILPVGLVYLLIWGRWNKLGILAGAGILGVLGYVFKLLLFELLGSFGNANHLFYYRVFLWHNYQLLVFLGILGVLGNLGGKEKKWILPVLFLATQGLITSFFLGQYTRYFYPVFPFLVLLAAGGLELIGEALGKLGAPNQNKFGPGQVLRGKMVWMLVLTFLVVAMGNKFTLLPKRVYSLNEDMQEIPEVDWKKIYGLVGVKLEENPGAVLVTNWNDLPVWYLGEGEPDYLTIYAGKKQDVFSSATLLYSLGEFKDIIKDRQRGILVVDSWDDAVPEGIREYCQENLKKELEIDRLYPVQPRYWPVSVYSWGMD